MQVTRSQKSAVQWFMSYQLICYTAVCGLSRLQRDAVDHCCGTAGAPGWLLADTSGTLIQHAPAPTLTESAVHDCILRVTLMTDESSGSAESAGIAALIMTSRIICCSSSQHAK